MCLWLPFPLNQVLTGENVMLHNLGVNMRIYKTVAIVLRFGPVAVGTRTHARPNLVNLATIYHTAYIVILEFNFVYFHLVFMQGEYHNQTLHESELELFLFLRNSAARAFTTTST
jgi:hypothetical protein